MSTIRAAGCAMVWLVAVVGWVTTTVALGQDRAAPISEPPGDVSLLPPREGVVMVKVAEEGRLNVSVGGWGGQRLVQAKTEPEKFRGYMKDLKRRGMNCARPLFHPPNAAKRNDAEWAPFSWEAMDRAVAITQEEGVYMIVDYHNWQVNDTIHADEATWLKNWGWIVDRYKGYKHLIFEGFNEPQEQCACLAEHYQKWIDLVRSKGAEQLCIVSPFWGPYFAVKDPANNWAICRHHYMNGKNSDTEDKGRHEADWHLRSPKNPDSALSAVRKFGCAFFMTECGIDDGQELDPGRVSGVKRAVNNCERQNWGWCLWAQGDWADEFDTFGKKIPLSITYSTITGEEMIPEQGLWQLPK